ncbi:type III pantothenate kinase [Aquimarina sp. TRL1]|uniref:type III pantothenate kinase n=1 Tax=Aquimarina sp. (strain TRL1) TaxID=2736252 RepID=UPI00158D25A5|nr:type III pantothenate kinase [Aquimarina sp. TRL1]QKX04260.1 type III pantothenate kinase [Aquimarina sp. TRL1]
MNLVVDVGNTYIKIGVFDYSGILYKEVVKYFDFKRVITKIETRFPEIGQAIVSSVGNMKSEDVKFLEKKIKTLFLDHQTRKPFDNLYKTPMTLGVDRVALIAAAVDQFPDKNVLVIDAGTCVTYDFKNKKEEYLGGAISPGIRLRYTSLHNHTAKLPLLTLEEPKAVVGDTTKEAIHSGVVHGILCEIDGVIEKYCNIYGDLTVILTGGDAHFLSKRLKNSIFATSNFLLEGLNYILAFNNTQ